MQPVHGLTANMPHPPPECRNKRPSRPVKYIPSQGHQETRYTSGGFRWGNLRGHGAGVGASLGAGAFGVDAAAWPADCQR
jgi:hypothetical protein